MLSTPAMLSAPLGAELQLRGGGGDAAGCAPGARQRYHSQQSCIIWAWLLGSLTCPKAQWGTEDTAPCCWWPHFQSW